MSVSTATHTDRAPPRDVRFNPPSRMTSCERVRRAFSYERPDRVPFQNGMLSGDFLAQWGRRYDVARADHRLLDGFYGSDVAEVAADHSPWPTRARTLEETDTHVVSVTGFGSTRRQARGLPFWETLASAIEEKSDLDALAFDPPDLERRYGCLGSLDEITSRYWVRCKVGGPYSRSKWLRGEEQFLIDLIEDPPFARALADRIAGLMIDVGLQTLARARLAHTAVHIHDDMASTQRMFFSPRVFEEVFFEPYRRMCAAFHTAGVKVFYGGEGNVSEIVDLLIGAGIDGFACLELRAGMDMVVLRERYGRGVLFFGNLCNTVTLPSGDRERIRAEVARQMAVARDGGCVVGPSHSIGADVTVESYEWMVEAVREMGDLA